jgi:hypothetical protein
MRLGAPPTGGTAQPVDNSLELKAKSALDQMTADFVLTAAHTRAWTGAHEHGLQENPPAVATRALEAGNEPLRG